MITDVLITSPILHGDGGDAPMNQNNPAGIADPVANRFADYGGINPDMDPELAMAMKVSMEEARQNHNQGKEEPNALETQAPAEEEYDE